MISLYAIFLIIIIHWIADFVFQAEKWALGKSKALKPLLMHTFTYSSIWYVAILIYSHDLNSSMWFMIITFVAHTITDYFTSKFVSKKFERKEFGSPIPNFGGFTYIGFDQVLHYVQLILTYKILFP